MKFTTFFKAALVAAFVAIGTAACSNDDDVIDDEVDTPDPEVPVVVDLKLTVTVNAGSNTTETVVTVVPSVDDAPYYASIWTKDEVGSASNDALKAKILEAEDFNDALYTGTTELSEILPTGDYVVVTMGWDGTTNTSTPAKKAFNVAPPSLTLTLGEVGSTDIRFSVTSTDPDATYIVGIYKTSVFNYYGDSWMQTWTKVLLNDNADLSKEDLKSGDLEDVAFSELDMNVDYTIFAYYCNADGSEYYGLVSASAKTVYPEETATSEYLKYVGDYVITGTGTYRTSTSSSTAPFTYEVTVEADVANYTYKVWGTTATGLDYECDAPAIWTFNKEDNCMYITENDNLGDASAYADAGYNFAFIGLLESGGAWGGTEPMARVVLNSDDSCTLTWRTFTSSSSGTTYKFSGWLYGMTDGENISYYSSDPVGMSNIAMRKGKVELAAGYEAYLGDWTLTGNGSYYAEDGYMYASDKNLTYNITIEANKANESFIVYGWENDEQYPVLFYYNEDGTVSLDELWYIATDGEGYYRVTTAITEDNTDGISIWLWNCLGWTEDPVATGSINGNTLSFQGNHLSYTSSSGTVYDTDCVGWMFTDLEFDSAGYLSGIYFYHTEWAKFPMSGSQSGTSAKASSKKNLSSMKFVKAPTMKLSSVANALNVYAIPVSSKKSVDVMRNAELVSAGFAQAANNLSVVSTVEVE